MVWVALVVIVLVLGSWIRSLRRTIDILEQRLLQLEQFEPMLKYLARDLAGDPGDPVKAARSFYGGLYSDEGERKT
jgi:hypothetical protein